MSFLVRFAIRTMHRKMWWAVFCVLPLTLTGAAQVVTGSEFTMAPSDTFTDASHTMSHYGLTWADFSNGTIGPSAMLSGYGGINFYTTGGRRMTITQSGNLGIGTSTPLRALTVYGETAIVPNTTNGTRAYLNISDSNGNNGGSNSFVIRGLGSNGAVGVSLANLELMATSVDVDGTMRVHGGGIVFPDGSTQSVAWTGSLCGGDYAESVNVAGDKTKYEPGDVLALTPDSSSDVIKTTEAYSTLVAGIYSTKPGVIGRRRTSPKDQTEVPMAMVGIVPTKVSTENGAIKKGDLLVSSATPGFAMKGTDRSRMLGAVIGKAMGNLESGNGVIEVLVSLQ